MTHVSYVCTECDKRFSVPSGAPTCREGFEDVAARPDDPEMDWPRYGLGCPWCDGESLPVAEAILAEAIRPRGDRVAPPRD